MTLLLVHRGLFCTVKTVQDEGIGMLLFTVTQSGGTEERKGVTVSAAEEFDIPNSRG